MNPLNILLAWVQDQDCKVLVLDPEAEAYAQRVLFHILEQHHWTQTDRETAGKWASIQVDHILLDPVC